MGEIEDDLRAINKSLMEELKQARRQLEERSPALAVLNDINDTFGDLAANVERVAAALEGIGELIERVTGQYGRHDDLFYIRTMDMSD